MPVGFLLFSTKSTHKCYDYGLFRLKTGNITLSLPLIQKTHKDICWSNIRYMLIKYKIYADQI